LSITNGLAVDKQHNVFADRTVFVQDLATRARVASKDSVERLPNRIAVDRFCRTRHVALEVWSKRNSGHGGIRFDEVPKLISLPAPRKQGKQVGR